MDYFALHLKVAQGRWPPAAWLGTAKAKDRVVEFFRLSKPLVDWIHTNVGPSTIPDRRR
jgi:hypothetical protein